MAELQQVESKMISHVGYDPETQELRLRFRNGGQEYKYSGFPPEKHGLLMKAESIGKFFQAEIRPHYVGTRVTEPVSA